MFPAHSETPPLNARTKFPSASGRAPQAGAQGGCPEKSLPLSKIQFSCDNSFMKHTTLIKFLAAIAVAVALSGCSRVEEARAFIKQCESKNESPALEALSMKDNGLFEAVVALGADVNIAGRDNVSALMWACRTGNKKQVQLLLNAGADVTVYSTEDLGPLEYAVISGNAQIVDMVAKAGADVNHVNKGDQTPLITAAAANDYKCITALVLNGAAVDWQDSNGDTALMYAVYNNAYRSAKTLVNLGAAPGIANNDGNSPFSIADDTMKKYLSRD